MCACKESTNIKTLSHQRISFEWRRYTCILRSETLVWVKFCVSFERCIWQRSALYVCRMSDFANDVVVTQYGLAYGMRTIYCLLARKRTVTYRARVTTGWPSLRVAPCRETSGLDGFLSLITGPEPTTSCGLPEGWPCWWLLLLPQFDVIVTQIARIQHNTVFPAT